MIEYNDALERQQHQRIQGIYQRNTAHAYTQRHQRQFISTGLDYKKGKRK